MSDICSAYTKIDRGAIRRRYKSVVAQSGRRDELNVIKTRNESFYLDGSTSHVAGNADRNAAIARQRPAFVLTVV